MHSRPSAHEVLNQVVYGVILARLLQIVAKLDIADELARGPLTADKLAKRVGAHGPSLHRALRALSSVGIFGQTADDRFRLTPLSQLLRTSRPASMRDWVQMANSGFIWQAFEALDRAIVNGHNPF